MPIEASELNSIQMVPIWAGASVGALGGRACFSSMEPEGRAEKVIFLRLERTKKRVSWIRVGCDSGAYSGAPLASAYWARKSSSEMPTSASDSS